jgi:hypothetical protein
MINPIEREWGVMQRQVTPNKCHATFAQFRTAMLAFLARVKCTGFAVEGVYLMISIAAQVTLTRGVTLLQRAYNFYCERRARDTPAVSSE